MFNGSSLTGWKDAGYKNQDPVTMTNGAIQLKPGKPFTGINWTSPFPNIEYEIQFEAMRLAGNDFFASLTFPVGESHCTLVTGGWGGDIVGLSSIDGWDASENETRTYINFENNQWYTFRIAVTQERIRVWLNEKPIIQALISGRTISLRPGDIEHSRPLGFASYNTAGAIRKVEYRSLTR